MILSFSLIEVNLWNKFPLNIKSALFIILFKKNFKNHLATKANSVA